MTVVDIAIQECIIWVHTLNILSMLAIFYLSWVELVKLFTFVYIIDPIQKLISWRGNHSSENINIVGKWMVIETKYICIVLMKSRAYFFGGGMCFWYFDLMVVMMVAFGRRQKRQETEAKERNRKSIMVNIILDI